MATWIYRCMCGCMYVCMYVCIYVCMCMDGWMRSNGLFDISSTDGLAWATSLDTMGA